jgi:hypothetical protein
MKRFTVCVLVWLITVPAIAAEPADSLQAIRQEMQQLRRDYQARLRELEGRLAVAEAALQAKQQDTAVPPTPEPRSRQLTASAFNPAISVILDGKYRQFARGPESYAIPGFTLGGEAGLGAQGLSLEESEVVISANVDDKYYGQMTVALHDHEGTTEVGLEEAFIETLNLPYGLRARAGRFYSSIGYLNGFHAHAWDFADQPLAYRAMLGRQYRDDGVQLNWLAPTDIFAEVGTELLRGGRFPADGTGDDVGAHSLFLHLGGDVGDSHSWRAGISQLWADVDARAVGEEDGHGHAHGDGGVEPSIFSGDSNLTIVDFVWKWAPHGNPARRNFKFQAEYFQRREDGAIAVDDGAEFSTYRGKQRGWYAQGIYQFMPRWRLGLRYDHLVSDNRGADPEVLAEAGLLADDFEPRRWSAMLDFANSEFSRWRLQYNRDESAPLADDQWLLQYVMSMGAHGAHQF